MSKKLEQKKESTFSKKYIQILKKTYTLNIIKTLLKYFLLP